MPRTTVVQEEYARLTVKIEVGDTRPFEAQDFKNLIQEAVRAVLGTFAPDYEVSGYDEDHKKGSVIAPGKDIQQIWAALSVFGLLFNRRVAVHFNALTEYTGEF